MDVEWTPDAAPDGNFESVGYQARLVAHYLRTLKEEGLSEHEACECTREFIAVCFDTGPED